MQITKIFAAVLAVLAISIGFGQAAGYPSKPVELVVHTSPGGGSDIYARLIVEIIGKEKLCPQPITVVNKVGGGGALAVNYVAERKDPHTLHFFSMSPFLSSFMKAKVQADRKDFRPIAMMGEDLNVYAVNTSSPYKEMKDVIAAAKKEPKKLTVGFGSVGGTGHLLAYMLAKQAGVEFNYLSHKGGAEAVLSALSGRIPMVAENPSEMYQHVKTGKLKIVGVPTVERHSDLPDVPTLKEMGYDVVYGTARGVTVFKGMPEEAISYWTSVFKKAFDHPMTQNFLKENMMRAEFLTEAKFSAYLDNYYKMLEPIVKEMGL